MNILDRLYYTYYWMFRNDGHSSWVAHLSVLVLLESIAIPYIGTLWFLLSLSQWESLSQRAHFSIFGREIPMYVGFFLFFAFLCIRFGWRKRSAYVTSQHDKYDNEKNKKLRKKGILTMCIGILIVILLLWIGLFINQATYQ